MDEGDVVAATEHPGTREGLAADLRRLGLAGGDTVLVHCSLAALGWVSGGAQTVILALQDVVTAAGTLVMPAQSGQLSDPAAWSRPAIPAAWHDAVRAGLPAYDPRTTPTRAMGAVAELFRTWPGAHRSAHPTCSFAALGPDGAAITVRQPLEDPFGEASPLGHLHRAGARVLLLGVGFDRCTALHLAERRAWPDRPAVEEGSPLLVDGARRWVRYRAPPLDPDTFPEAGRFLAAHGIGRAGRVGAGACYLLPMVEAVDAVAAWWGASSGPGRADR